MQISPLVCLGQAARTPPCSQPSSGWILSSCRVDDRNHGITVLGRAGPKGTCCNSVVLQMRKPSAWGPHRAGRTFPIPASAPVTEGRTWPQSPQPQGQRSRVTSTQIGQFGADAPLALGALFSPDRPTAATVWPQGWRQGGLGSCLPGSLLVSEGPHCLPSLPCICGGLDSKSRLSGLEPQLQQPL